jgi:hemolysin III
MTADIQVATLSLEQRPALRGWLHAAAVLAAVVGAAVLLLVASSARAYVGGAIFAASLFLLYGTSAAYHRFEWNPTARSVVKRIDHAMIFVLIAGTYTPLCLHVSLAWGIPMLAVVWGIAGAGILMKVAWPDAPRWLSVTLYLALGWLSLVAARELVASFSAVELTMLALGGVLYTIGSLVYAARWPDPWPRIFGYHEVFHVFVVAGSVLHFTLVAVYVLPG